MFCMAAFSDRQYYTRYFKGRHVHSAIFLMFFESVCPHLTKTTRYLTIVIVFLVRKNKEQEGIVNA